MSRTELWEAPKGAPVDGHVAFTVDDDETVRLPYILVTQLLREKGLRRKISTDHGVRYSLQPADTAPPAPPVGHRPPPGFRWLTPRECHGGSDYCRECSPNSPQRRVTKTDV